MSLTQLIRSKLVAHYAPTGVSRDITWLLRKWREDFPADFRRYKLYSRDYWDSFV